MAAPEGTAPRTAGGDSILAVVGPTACGKTGLVLELARRRPIEVISLDSRQIYAGLRVGTAQPTAAERAACPHHLVDFLPVDETYDAASFRRDFQRVYREIRARGAIPVLAGGAGFYLRALTDGFMDLPPRPGRDLGSVRAEVENLTMEAVNAKLGELDPDSLDRIHPHDHYRLRRALEIVLLTGTPMTAHAAAWRPDPVLGLDFRILVLEPDPSALERRISRRLDAMLAGGWIEETAAALQNHDSSAQGLQSIGYPEVIALIRGQATLRETRERILLQTRQYAKRQRTWFRKAGATWRRDPRSGDLPEILDRAVAP